MNQKTKQIEEAIAAAQTTQQEQMAGEQGIVLRDFDGVLQPIIESCTKDSISAGKYEFGDPAGFHYCLFVVS